jgi:hypothetical protein
VGGAIWTVRSGTDGLGALRAAAAAKQWPAAAGSPKHGGFEPPGHQTPRGGHQNEEEKVGDLTWGSKGGGDAREVDRRRGADGGGGVRRRRHYGEGKRERSGVEDVGDLGHAYIGRMGERGGRGKAVGGAPARPLMVAR